MMDFLKLWNKKAGTDCDMLLNIRSLIDDRDCMSDFHGYHLGRSTENAEISTSRTTNYLTSCCLNTCPCGAKILA